MELQKSRRLLVVNANKMTEPRATSIRGSDNKNKYNPREGQQWWIYVF